MKKKDVTLCGMLLLLTFGVGSIVARLHIFHSGSVVWMMFPTDEEEHTSSTERGTEKKSVDDLDTSLFAVECQAHHLVEWFNETIFLPDLNVFFEVPLPPPRRA